MLMGCLALLLGSPPSLPQEVIELIPRRVVALAPRLSPEFRGARNLSEMFRVFRDVLDEETRLDAQLVDAQLVEACLGRRVDASLLVCQVEAAFESTTEDPQLLLFARGTGAEKTSELILFWLDLEALRPTYRTILRRAARAMDGASRRQALERLNTEIQKSLRVGKSRPAASLEALQQAIRSALDEELSELLTQRNLRQAELRVRLLPSGSRLSLDSKVLRPIALELTIIRGLSPGAHEIVGTRPGYLQKTVNFDMPETGRLGFDIRLREDRGTFWDVASGLGITLAAVGLGFGVYGLVEAGNRSQPFQGSGRMIRLVGGRDEGPTLDNADAGVGEGPLVGGLAAGLMISGGLLTVLSFTERDDEREAWLEVLISLGSGFVVYGTAELFDRL